MRDSPSSGERTGISLNLPHVIVCRRCALGVVGATAGTVMPAKSYKRQARRTQLESWAIAGDSPVFESGLSFVDFPSSTAHVKRRVNPRGPSRKAKYCL
jgi:hypothetical protein